MRNTTPPARPARDPYGTAEYIAELDSSGVRRGGALSSAYQFATGFREVADEAAKVRVENAWAGQQAARYPGRLVAFCSINPLRDYALDELAHLRGRSAPLPGVQGRDADRRLHYPARGDRSHSRPPAAHV